MNAKTRKRIAKRPVKELTASERAAWLRSVQAMREMARVDPEARRARWSGHVTDESSDDLTVGGTDPKEFWARKENGSV